MLETEPFVRSSRQQGLTVVFPVHCFPRLYSSIRWASQVQGALVQSQMNQTSDLLLKINKYTKGLFVHIPFSLHFLHPNITRPEVSEGGPQAKQQCKDVKRFNQEVWRYLNFKLENQNYFEQVYKHSERYLIQSWRYC